MTRCIFFVVMCVGVFAGASSSWALPLVYSQDAIQFDGSNSGNTLIGKTCVAGTYDACLQVTGDVQDLTSLIDTFIPEGEICCGDSSISVQIDNAATSTVTALDDDYYGDFAGSVTSSDTGAADTLNWDSAVYGSPFSIDLTNAVNVVTDVLFNVGSSLTNTAAPTSAPEPTSIALLCTALLGAGFARPSGGDTRRHTPLERPIWRNVSLRVGA